MTEKTFQSQLGDVKITDEGLERKKAGDWENILSEYPEEKMVDEARFAEIEGIKLEQGSIHPCIKLKIGDDWQYLFFQVNDRVKNCWKNLRYQWQAYLQNHSSEFTRK